MKRKVFDAEFIRKYGILMVLVIMWVIMLAVSPTFRTVSNAVNILRQVAVNGILAIGMTFVIMTGGIDLTVGSLVAVAAVTSVLELFTLTLPFLKILPLYDGGEIRSASLTEPSVRALTAQ